MQYNDTYIALRPVLLLPLAQTGEETRVPQLLAPGRQSLSQLLEKMHLSSPWPVWAPLAWMSTC